MSGRYTPRHLLALSAQLLILTLMLNFLPMRKKADLLPLVGADITYWDQERGLRTVWDNPRIFTQVSPWWYAPNADGSVVVQQEEVRTDRAAVARLQGADTSSSDRG